MKLRDTPIRRKLIRAIMLTSGAVLLLTCTSFFAYDFITFREATRTQLSTLAEIVAMNSTAALAFDSREDAEEILASMKAERHIRAAGLYDKEGKLFALYPADADTAQFPFVPEDGAYTFRQSFLEGFQPVMQNDRRLGTLFMRSDTGALTARLKLYGIIVSLIIVGSFTIAYVISERLQRGISKPILALAETVKEVSDNGDYSIRAVKEGQDEVGYLTDSFNKLLIQIQEKNEAIRLFNLELEQKVQERTIELETANKELESFSYSISHDLRAPIRSIHGYMSIFREDYGDQFDDEGQRLMKIVTDNANRMGRLIDDLLAFAKLGRKEIVRTDVDVQRLVQNIVGNVLEGAPTQPDLHIQDLPGVRADQSLIEQVWINLISNAVKYSSKKENPIVEIGSSEDEREVVFFVKDNGAGFSMDYVNKLFGVFQRLHKASEFEGTGVGLAIVHRIVTKHGGRVWADGKLGEGAMFSFSLPKAVDEQVSAQS